MTEDEMNREILRWKRVAAYLASCHAATLEGLPKSASKSSRQRHANICTKAARFLKGEEEPQRYYNGDDDSMEADIRRCIKAAETYGLSQRAGLRKETTEAEEARGASTETHKD